LKKEKRKRGDCKKKNMVKKNGLNNTKGLLALAVTLNSMELFVASMKKEIEKERKREERTEKRQRVQ